MIGDPPRNGNVQQSNGVSGIASETVGRAGAHASTVETISPGVEASIRAAQAAALVAGVFALIVAGLLVGNWIEMRWLFPGYEERLIKMKKALAANPNDPQLVERIRTVDLRLREKRLRRQDMAVKGGYLLLGCVTVCLVGLRVAQQLQFRWPVPQPVDDDTAIQRQVRQGRLGRWAVTGALLLTAAAWAVAILWPMVRFDTGQGPPAQSFPTMEEFQAQWPTFRGPQGSGVCTQANMPTEWDAATGKNIAWKTPLDGRDGGIETLPGFNSPVVWGDRVFFSGATREQRQVYCFDLETGAPLWTAEVPTGTVLPEDWELMRETGYAPNTMAVDGRRAYAIFPTGDVAAVDFNGNIVWHRSLGLPDSAYGYASSLALYQDLLIVQFDQIEDDDGNPRSKLYALDTATGDSRWEQPRAVRDSWTSPVVVPVGNGWQVITAAEPKAIGYDPADGRVLWTAEEIMGDLAPSPITAGNRALIVEVYNRIIGIPLDQGGDVSDAMETLAEDGLPDITSPVSNGTLLWMVATEGLLTCWDLAATVDDPAERKLYEHEFEKESFYASPVLAEDRLYLLSAKGRMHIIAAGREFQELAVCSLDDGCLASPAMVDGRIVIRSARFLWCIKAAP